MNFVKKSFFYSTLTTIIICRVLTASGNASAGNWPMWRYDEGRSAAAADPLPAKRPVKVWEHVFTPRKQVWDSPLNNFLMQYDKFFEPIVYGQTLFVGFNDSDKMVAIDTRSGKIKWTFYTGGPIRLAPVAYHGAVYFGSDDGVFYCLDIETGEEKWTFRAAPASHHVFGNRRVISMWPIRGGAVIKDDVVCFSAGIWPFMGVFIYALDIETGQLVWLNDSDSIQYQDQPHRPSKAFAGVAPQGSMAISGNKLLVPGGRSIPAVLDCRTGKTERYDFEKHTKYVGGDFIAAQGNTYYTRARKTRTEIGVSPFEIESGTRYADVIEGIPVFDKEATYFSGNQVRAYATGPDGRLTTVETSGEDNKGDARKKATGAIVDPVMLWSLDVDATGDLIKAGNRLYAAGTNRLTAIDLTGEKGRIAWQLDVSGEVKRLIAGDDRLFAVTGDGRMMMFSAQGGKPAVYTNQPRALPPISAETKEYVETVLEKVPSRSGLALIDGLDNASLINALLTATDYTLIVLDPSAGQVKNARESYDKAGIYGTRIAIHEGTPTSFNLAPYALDFAYVNGRNYPRQELDAIVKSMRPYSGTLIYAGEKDAAALHTACAAQGFSVKSASFGSFAVREQPLKGSAPWTHNLGSISQSAKSDDQRVRLPLGILWWGGSSNMDVLPRHAHGPAEQVIGGRLFIQGTDSFSARDVYTGRVLWKRKIKGLNEDGVFFAADQGYDPHPLAVGYNQRHMPGANVRGDNFVATADRLYLLHGSKCLILDVATGRQLDTYTLPNNTSWGYIGIKGDYLIAGSDFADFSEYSSVDGEKREGNLIYSRSSSSELVVMNRHNGKVIWTQKADIAFLHNAITASDSTLFCIDRTSPSFLDMMSGQDSMGPTPIMKAFDLRTGKQKWTQSEDVFGTFLSYSSEHNLLIQAFRASRDSGKGEEGIRMAAVNASNGKTQWDRKTKYKTFPIIHNNNLISESGMWDIKTGKPVERVNPITGEKELWEWSRTYGCNHPVASENLLTFRSGAASFYDLAEDGGVGNFGGFKSGCSINLIAADGVLSAPDYTRTCSCSYQNQTSLALVHMPDIEFWTSSSISYNSGERINRIGLNFGAPGDRKAGKTYWVDYPSVGGNSPDPDVEVNSEALWHLSNALRFGKDDYNWVYASTAENILSLSITVGESGGNSSKESTDTEKESAADPVVEAIPYTVKLFFAEHDDLSAGERVFSISLNRKKVCSDLDVVEETGAARRGLVKEFKNVVCTEDLEVDLTPKNGSKPPILAGIEIIRE